MAQLTVPVLNTQARPGMLATGNAEHAELKARTNVNEVLEFGQGVVDDGTTADQDRTPQGASTAANFLGVTVLNQRVEFQNDVFVGVEGIAQFQAHDVLTKGEIWVAIDSNIAIGDAVHLVRNNAGGDTVGHFRATADAGNTTDLSTTLPVQWTLGGTAALGFARLELNLP
jgi:hypothetical protein